MSISINIIGAGKLGKTIAKLITTYADAKIIGICNRSLESAQEASQFIGAGKPYLRIEDLPPADLTLITTNDSNISISAYKLSLSPNLKRNSTIIHFCGSLPSDILSSTKEKECYIASIHPMRTFSDPELSTRQFRGTFCAIEGDHDIIPFCIDLCKQIGGRPFTIRKEQKPLYHASAVVAANYVITLAHIAIQMLEQSGVSHEISSHVAISMMESAINNLTESLNPEESLTGPIKRGDHSTVRRHIAAIPDKQMKKIYSQLGFFTLCLANHSPEETKKLINSLKVDDLDYDISSTMTSKL